jgi:hypothetical protein
MGMGNRQVGLEENEQEASRLCHRQPLFLFASRSMGGHDGPARLTYRLQKRYVQPNRALIAEKTPVPRPQRRLKPKQREIISAAPG